MARGTVMRFKGQRNPQETARALGVGAVVTGALSRRGNQIVISAELIHAATGERLWGQTFDRPMTDSMSVQDTIVLSIAEGLRLRLSGEEKARLGGYGTNNAKAYELSLKGRFLMQERDRGRRPRSAQKLFRQATEGDPNFLDAHLAIASVYARRAGGGYDSPREGSRTRRRGAGQGGRDFDPKSNVAVRVVMMHQTLRQDARLGRRRARESPRDARPGRPSHGSIPPNQPSSSSPSGDRTRLSHWWS